MLRYLFFVIFVFFYSSGIASPTTKFIEFSPIAAVSQGFTFGISEVKIGKKIVYTISFKKGKDVFVMVPESIVNGYYPNLTFTGLAISDSQVVIGGKESHSLNAPWVLLFNIEKNKISIVDIISKASINEYIYNFEYGLPNINAPSELKDLDNDKINEFELDFSDTGIKLYAEIEKNGIKLDYTSKVYNDIFNQLDNFNEKDEYQFIQYLLYGSLAGRLSKTQAEHLYISYIRESNLQLKQCISNIKRIKELAELNNLTGKMVEYLLQDIEQEAFFKLVDKQKNSKEFKQRLLLLDEQLKLLKIDEIILSDFSTYIAGYISDDEFEDLLTIAISPFYQDIASIISNIFILDNIIHKSGYKMIYLKAGI